MTAQGFDEFFKRLDATTHRSVTPVVQVLPGVPRAVVFPEYIECFLDAVSPDGFQIVGEQVVESGPLPHGEILGTLQKAIARLAQHRIVSFGVEPLGFLAACLVDGFVEFFHNVEPVENVERGGEHSLDDFQIGLPHVGADDGDGGTALGAKLLEPAGQGTFLAVLDDADEASRTIVDLVDEGHVVVAKGVGDLVDADGGDSFETAVGQAVVHRPFDTAKHGVPLGVELEGGLLPTEMFGPLGQKKAEHVGALVFSIGPRNQLDGDAAPFAIHAAHPVAEAHLDVPKRDEREGAVRRHVIIDGTFALAVRADGSRVLAGDDPDFDHGEKFFANHADLVIHKGLDWMHDAQ